MDIALLLFLLQLDTVAALALIPYLLYRAYGVWWGMRCGSSTAHRLSPS
jgi:hypothetical protein